VRLFRMVPVFGATDGGLRFANPLYPAQADHFV
jgi:hypothetical protein